MNWCSVADRKRVDLLRKGTFIELVGSAEVAVPFETKAQIAADAPRTLIGLPAGCQAPQKTSRKIEATLRRVLVALEWRNTNGHVRGTGSTYTQGMSFLAAFCLRLCCWEEEAGFFLLSVLVEDVLGLSFFCEWPPMLGYHADTAVLQKLVPLACPQLAKVLGNELPDLVSIFAVRTLISCFVNSGLAEEPLTALWTELLLCESIADMMPLRRLPLLIWLVGVLKAVEADILAAIDGAEQSEHAALAYQAALAGIKALPNGWRPQNLLPPPSEVADMICAAQREHLAMAESLNTQKLGMSPELTHRLQQEFLRLPQKGQSGIDEKTLQEVLARLSPGYEYQAQAIFALLDRDGSRSLDFFELMVGIIVLREGSWSRKLELLFQLYDTDGSGALEMDELHCLSLTLAKLGNLNEKDASMSHVRSSMVSGASQTTVPAHLRRRRSAYIPELEEADRIKRRLLLMDHDRDGRLSLDEWKTGAIADPAVKQLLACVGISGADRTAEPSPSLPEHLERQSCMRLCRSRNDSLGDLRGCSMM